MSDIPEMVERVARAIWDQTATPPFPFETINPAKQEQLRHAARAAIAAMREPTQSMIVDGFEAMKGDWQMCREAAEDANRCWQAMIDAALAPKTASA